MPFSSPAFLTVVLPLLIGGYFSIPEKWRNGFLLFASLLFYLWIEPVAIVVMVFLSISSYYLARLTIKHRFALIIAIALNVVILSIYKYNRFLFNHINLQIDKFALAAGMSFYVFQLIPMFLMCGAAGLRSNRCPTCFYMLPFYPRFHVVR